MPEAVASSDDASDNHTIGCYFTTSVTVPNPVPEPGIRSLPGSSAVGLLAARRRKKR